MPDFKFLLSWAGTFSFYFLVIRGAHLTKNGAHSTHCHQVSLNKVKLGRLCWNAVQKILIN